MKTDGIKEIGINEKEQLYIRPEKEQFPLIYRTATEVHWNSKEQYLHSPKPREWTYLDWFKHILNVTELECNCKLMLTKTTKWTNIPETLKAKISSN